MPLIDSTCPKWNHTEIIWVQIRIKDLLIALRQGTEDNQSIVHVFAVQADKQQTVKPHLYLQVHCLSTSA